jgi:hypothetical protein
MSTTTISRAESTHSVNGNLSDYIQKRLDQAPPRGKGSGRHDDISWLSGQLDSIGWHRETIFQTLRARYADQPDKTDKEIFDLIDGAKKLGYQPANVAGTTFQPRRAYSIQKSPQALRIKPYVHDGSVEELPSNEIKLPFSKFLKDVLGFRDDEFAWFGIKEEMEGGARDGEICLKQWKEGTPVKSIDQPWGRQTFSLDDRAVKGFSEHGTYFAINPFKNDKSRTQENVSRYLYTMVEHDDLPKEEQLAIYKRLNLAIAALIDTGGKSLHAIVRIDACTLF